MNIASYIDHTLLKPDASERDIKKLCAEAREHGFFSVCVNPCWVPLCKSELEGSGVKVCTVIGFPLGANTLEDKVYEAKNALKNGADELDMVINIGFLKSGRNEDVYHDIIHIRNIGKDFVLKVIIETALLTDEEKKKACHLAACAGADFVKTSTGFSKGGATVEDVKLMKECSEGLKVKASGGIRDFQTFKAMLDAGAARIGASAGIKIIEEGQ